MASKLFQCADHLKVFGAIWLREAQNLDVNRDMWTTWLISQTTSGPLSRLRETLPKGFCSKRFYSIYTCVNSTTANSAWRRSLGPTSSSEASNPDWGMLFHHTHWHCFLVVYYMCYYHQLIYEIWATYMGVRRGGQGGVLPPPPGRPCYFCCCSMFCSIKYRSFWEIKILKTDNKVYFVQ